MSKDAAAKEEEDLAKGMLQISNLALQFIINNCFYVVAIALSLKEAETTSKAPSSSLYPSVYASAPAPAAKEGRKVRALYDFEAVEDNELTCKAGEISKLTNDTCHERSSLLYTVSVFVTDDSDPNWWKGSNHRGEGLFPANFVTSDLDAEPEPSVRESSKRVQFNEKVAVATLEETASSEAEVEIDEAKIDRLLQLLHEADPTGERNDPDDLKTLEGILTIIRLSEQVNAIIVMQQTNVQL